MSKDFLDRIQISGLVTDCIIGVYKEERHKLQPIHIDLQIACDTRGAARSSSLARTLDYAKLTADIRFILSSSRFYLLETAADALCRYILAVPTDDRPQIQARRVDIALSKPSALSPDMTATVHISRTRKDYDYGKEQTAFGMVDVIAEYRECGIYRLLIEPGKSIATHVHHTMHEWEMALSDGLRLQGKPLRAGLAHRWPHDFAHRYDNPTDLTRTVLCIDSPPFIPTDEQTVTATPRPLSELPAGHVIDYYKLGEPHS